MYFASFVCYLYIFFVRCISVDYLYIQSHLNHRNVIFCVSMYKKEEYQEEDEVKSSASEAFSCLFVTLFLRKVTRS